jgi:DNA-directed RNA polymerase specialized sigma24 family protein
LVNDHGPALILDARQWRPVPVDIVQDAFVKLATLTETPRDVTARLCRVVRNRALDAGRPDRRRLQREQRAARPER